VRDLVHIDAAGEEVCLMPELPMMDDDTLLLSVAAVAVMDDDDDDDDALPGVEERKTGRTPNVNATSL
jgi:hypothetical protein